MGGVCSMPGGTDKCLCGILWNLEGINFLRKGAGLAYSVQ